MTSAPVLALPDDNEEYVVFYDASRRGLGGVLMQHDRVIAYAFEVNYPTHDLELVAVVTLRPLIFTLITSTVVIRILPSSSVSVYFN